MIYQVKGISGYVWVGAVWAGVCAGVPGCAQVSTDVRKCTYMYLGVYGCEWVCACVLVCAGVHGCVWKSAEVRWCLRVCVLDEFSEYLQETRVNTSADFNTYPIRIFLNKLNA